MEHRTFIHCLVWLFFGLSCGLKGQAQNIIEGTVMDAANQERLIGVTISVVGTDESVITNVDGRFLISLNLDEPRTLELYLKGYQRETVTLIEPTPVSVSLERIYSQGFRMLSQSTFKETELLNADFSVDHVNSMELLEMPNGPGLDGLSNYHSLFSVRPGDRMQVWDFRGFSNTEFSRALHLTDGVDMAIPDLGSPVGMMTTPVDIDIAGIEMRNGPSSTLHGNGAYSGLLAYSSKGPWQQRGLSVSLRGATGSEIDAQARFAQLLDKKQRWGIKIVGQFNRLDAQFGSDNSINRYGALDETNAFNPQTIANDLGLDSAQGVLVNRYFNWAESTEPNALVTQRKVFHEGFTEDEIAEPETRLLKLNGSLYFRIDPKIQVSYDYRMGLGTGFYQADSRFNLHNYLWQQHALRASGKNWKVAAYGTFSHSGNSYNLVGSATQINATGRDAYLTNYLVRYADSLNVLSNGFQTGLPDSLIDEVRQFAGREARSAWFIPGTSSFDSIADIAQNTGSGSQLSALNLRSATQGINGQYMFDLKWMNILVGMNVKRDNPRSEGRFYSDSSSTLSFIEAGGKAILSSSFFKEKLVLKAGVQVSKHELFKTQVNPSGAVRLRLRNNVVWAGYNSGYRNPNYWELFRSTYDGNSFHSGNSVGFEHVASRSTTVNVSSILDEAINGNAWPNDCPPGDMDCLYQWASDSLVIRSFEALQPERVSSAEVGFRSIIFKNLFVDLSGYYSWHDNRIYYETGMQVTSDQVESVALMHPDSSPPTQIQFPVNSTERLYTMGGSVNVTYHFSDRIWANANYTYTKLMTEDHGSLATAGFNVPNHRMNVGLRLRKIWKGLGFSSNFRLHDSYTWQSRIGSFEVPWTMILDAQISYQIPKLHSTFRVGGSNIINSPYRSVAGGSPLASTFYASILFDLSLQ